MLDRSGLPVGLGSNPNVQDQAVCHAAGALWMFDRPIRAVVLKIACALTTFGVVAWNSVLAAAESEAITIGAVLPLTGEAAHWGIPPHIVRGARLPRPPWRAAASGRTRAQSHRCRLFQLLIGATVSARVQARR